MLRVYVVSVWHSLGVIFIITDLIYNCQARHSVTIICIKTLIDISDIYHLSNQLCQSDTFITVICLLLFRWKYCRMFYGLMAYFRGWGNLDLKKGALFQYCTISFLNRMYFSFSFRYLRLFNCMTLFITSC